MSDLWFYPYLLIFALIVIDYFTGIFGAVKTDSFSSSKMRQGLFHKLAYLLVIVVAFIIEELAAFYDLGFVNGIVALVCVWIIITEIGSILENLVVINPAFADNSFMAIFARREEQNNLYENFEANAIDALEAGQTISEKED